MIGERRGTGRWPALCRGATARALGALGWVLTHLLLDTAVLDPGRQPPVGPPLGVRDGVGLFGHRHAGLGVLVGRWVSATDRRCMAPVVGRDQGNPPT